jgi:hypothetical protein
MGGPFGQLMLNGLIMGILPFSCMLCIPFWYWRMWRFGLATALRANQRVRVGRKCKGAKNSCLHVPVSLRGHEFSLYSAGGGSSFLPKSVNICQTTRRHVTEYLIFLRSPLQKLQTSQPSVCMSLLIHPAYPPIFMVTPTGATCCDVTVIQHLSFVVFSVPTYT